MQLLLLFIPLTTVITWMYSLINPPKITIPEPASTTTVLSIQITITPNPTSTVTPTMPVVTRTPTQTVMPTQTIPVNQLVTLVNAYRKEKGLKALAQHAALCTLATDRSRQITTDWSHNNFEDSAKRLCPECISVGENLAKDYGSPFDIVQAWAQSPEHKRIMEADWDWGCSATYNGNYTSFIFGKKK
jgi:uncharacterized protein YkwD